MSLDLTDLDLADHSRESDLLEVDLLIGSDHYWKLVTGRVVCKEGGPVTIQTRLGWVLSGPVEGLSCRNTSCNLVSTHNLVDFNFAILEKIRQLPN